MQTGLIAKITPDIILIPFSYCNLSGPQNQWNKNSVWSVFCSQGCYTDFFYKYWQQVIAIAPRLEALETPIEDPVKKQNAYGWLRTEIKKVDNNSNP